MNDSKSSSSSDKENASPDETEADRDSEVIGLKALISSKNERIATLRTVLKANKTTAESGKYKSFFYCNTIFSYSACITATKVR